MKFESRKNVVEQQNTIVVKHFESEENFENECRILKILNGRCSPKMLCAKNEQVEMEFIDGERLVDLFVGADLQQIESLAKMMAECVLQIFSILKTEIPNDENFRNYVVYQEKIYRLDFEETTTGTLLEWCAKILAFAFLYHNSEEVKLAFAKKLALLLKVVSNDLIENVKKETCFLEKRWNVKCSKKLLEDFEKEMTLFL